MFKKMKIEQLDDKKYKGAIVFVCNKKGIWSKLISFYSNIENLRFEKDLPTHTEIYIGNGLCVSADFPRIRKVRLDRHFSKYEEVWIAVYNNITEEGKEKVVKYAESNIGNIYDVFGFLGFLNKIPILSYLLRNTIISKIDQVDWAFFCSELVLLSYMYALGTEKFNNSYVSPAQLFFELKQRNDFEIKKIWGD